MPPSVADTGSAHNDTEQPATGRSQAARSWPHMITLRVTILSGAAATPSAEICLEGDGVIRQTALADLNWRMSAQDEEDLRWYLEDFLLNPYDPSPQLAARIEGRMAEMGREVFGCLFRGNEDARALWAVAQEHLSQIRIEVAKLVRFERGPSSHGS